MKKRNFWSEDKIIYEIKKVTEEIGHFPSNPDLSNLKRWDLTNIISSTGGMAKYRKIFGVDSLRKDRNYWLVWENLEKEIFEAFGDMIKRGVFPSRNQLRNTFSAIGRPISHFGGIVEVARKMGCIHKSILKSPDGHLLNSRYEFILDLYFIQNEIPHFVNGLIHPSRKFRYDFKVGDHYIEIWGLSGKKNYDSVKNEKKQFYNDLGLSLIEIECDIFENSLSDVYKKLNDLFSEMSTFSESPSEEFINSYKNMGFWTFENTLVEIKSIVDKTGCFPTYKYLKSSGNSGLHYAMCKHGGIYFFRNLLGIRKKYQKV